MRSCLSDILLLRRERFAGRINIEKIVNIMRRERFTDCSDETEQERQHCSIASIQILPRMQVSVI